MNSTRAPLAMAACCLALAGTTACQGFEPEIIEHTGMAEASAAIAIGTNQVLIANDGDNRIRLFATDKPGAALKTYDLDAWFPSVGKNTEMDLEGAAKVGSRIYWIGSHSHSKEGKPRPSRQIFLATELSTPAGSLPRLQPAGKPCRSLIDQWLASSGARDLLGAGMAADPEDINIEGLAERADGGLFIGFRSPLAHEDAILAPLLNPDEVLAGKPASFGAPVTLDLDGQGIRDITWTGHEYFLIAGGTGGGGRSSLVRWRGPGHRPNPVRHLDLKHLNPEGIAVFGDPADPRLYIVSDDGSQADGGLWGTVGFRSFWFEPYRKRR